MVKIQSDFMKFGQRSHGYYMYKLGPFGNTNVTYTHYILRNTKIQLKIQPTFKT